MRRLLKLLPLPMLFVILVGYVAVTSPDRPQAVAEPEALPAGVTPEITLKSGTLTREQVARAIEVWRRACPTFGIEHWSDIVEIRAEASEEFATYRLELGWKNYIDLGIRLSADVREGGDFASRWGPYAGTVQWYELGSGAKETGLFATKRASQWLCGLAVDDTGAKVFKRVPELKFLSE